MSLSNVQDYAYLNAKIHGKKSKFLSAKDYDRLYNAATSEDLYRLISSSNIVSDELSNLLLSNTDFSSREIDQILIKDFQTKISIISRQLPQYTRKFVMEYEKRFFVDALKIILKAKHFNMATQEIQNLIVVPSPKHAAMVDQLIKLQSVNSIIEQTPIPEYRIALQEALSDYELEKSPLIFEMALYKAYYKKLWMSNYTIRLSDRNSVFGIIGTEVDLINMLSIIRAKNLGMDPDLITKWLIPKNYKIPQQTIDAMKQVSSINQIDPIIRSIPLYRELAQQISEILESPDVPIEKLERKFKEFLIHKSIRMISSNPFQLGIFFGYMTLAQTEFSNIRAILIGKMAELSPEEIKDSIIYF
jgi:V/A-type H+-transporting ATPase subunit C